MGHAFGCLNHPIILAGWFHFWGGIFTPRLGEMLQFDEHIFFKLAVKKEDANFNGMLTGLSYFCACENSHKAPKTPFHTNPEAPAFVPSKIVSPGIFWDSQ